MKIFDTIQTDLAPKALGPYSQATIADRFIFISGQIGISPATGELVDLSIDAQIAQVFSNIEAILSKAGVGLNSVIKLTIFVRDMAHFSKVNEAMLSFFNKPYPARSTVQVSGLPKNAAIEIEAMALR